MPVPPVPPLRPATLTRADGSTVLDPYHGLREPDETTLGYLRDENDYAATVFAGQRTLADALTAAIAERAERTASSAPTLDRGYLYYTRIVEGQQYPVHCRRPAPAGVDDTAQLPDELRLPVPAGEPPADEQILCDENLAAAGHDYYDLAALSVSPCGRFVAEAVDVTGGERYQIKVRDIASGQVLDDTVRGAAPHLAWRSDSAAFVYATVDERRRAHQARLHVVGEPPEDDRVLLDEHDPRFHVHIATSSDHRQILVDTSSPTSSETHLFDAATLGGLGVVAEREAGHEYTVDVLDGTVYVLTNADGAADFRLVTAPLGGGRDAWQPLVDHRPGVRLEAAVPLRWGLVLCERTEARTQLRVTGTDGHGGRVLDIGDPVSTATFDWVCSPDSRTLRVSVSSLTQPDIELDVVVDPAGHDELLEVRRRQVDGYEPERYETWRDWAVADDGVRVPVTLLRRVGSTGPQPCLVEVYGAYGAPYDPQFCGPFTVLADRGVTVAIAHVRGGGDLGQAWHDAGRRTDKATTFTDLAAVADHLVRARVAAPGQLAVRGASAGGLTVAATVNLDLDRFAVAVAEVPFLDVITTMSDDTLPLVSYEYDEWGDPRDLDVLDAMAGYSPYDRVVGAPKALLVTAGLNDPRVGFFEPAKYVAKLRSVTGAGTTTVLHTEIGAGHAGRSVRAQAWADEARTLAFVLDGLGLTG